MVSLADDDGGGLALWDGYSKNNDSPDIARITTRHIDPGRRWIQPCRQNRLHRHRRRRRSNHALTANGGERVPFPRRMPAPREPKQLPACVPVSSWKCAALLVLEQSPATVIVIRCSTARETSLTSAVHWQYFLMGEYNRDDFRYVHRQYKCAFLRERGALAYRAVEEMLMLAAGLHFLAPPGSPFHGVIVSWVPSDTGFARIREPDGWGRVFNGVP